LTKDLLVNGGTTKSSGTTSGNKKKLMYTHQKQNSEEDERTLMGSIRLKKPIPKGGLWLGGLRVCPKARKQHAVGKKRHKFGITFRGLLGGATLRRTRRGGGRMVRSKTKV